MTAPHVRVMDPRELAAFPTPEGWPQLSADEIAAHAPDASMVVGGDSEIGARCSLWWSDVPPYGEERVGVVGHYGAVGVEEGKAILDAATRQLAVQGCTFAIGPMDGNTWRRYRLVVEPGTEPPFFLEPTNPPDWPTHYSAAGFTPLAHYFSAINIDLSRRNERVGAVAERLAQVGVTLRVVDLAHFERDLHRIYSVAEIAFREAFLYTPLPEPDFAAQYHRIRQFVRPELVIVAEHGERTVGFAFSIPDVLELARGGPPRTAILKTLAVLPERAYAGLGSLLTDRSHEAARASGFERVIHALMHESNRSRNISAHTGRHLRRYALFGQHLGRP
jgi:GNAT superfamily N-acetyltransferase